MSELDPHGPVPLRYGAGLRVAFFDDPGDSQVLNVVVGAIRMRLSTGSPTAGRAHDRATERRDRANLNTCFPRDSEISPAAASALVAAKRARRGYRMRLGQRRR